MSFDDDADDDSTLFGPPPHPDDRLWRHPSELGARPGRAFASPFVAPGPAGAAARPRPWAVVAAAVGAAGAVLAGLGVAVVGVGDGSGAPAAERPAVAPTAAAMPQVDDATLVSARDAVAPTVVALGPALGAPPAAAPPALPPAAGPLAVAPPTGTGTGPHAGTTRSSTAPGEAAADAAELDATGGASAAGSGVIVRAEGIVVTSRVLVGTGPVQVRLADGRSVAGDVLASDAVTGLAVLDLAGDGYPVATAAADGTLAPGTQAVAVGAAPAAGQPSQATGALAGASQRVVDGGGGALEGVVEVDGASAATALGGPVVDGDGAVLGVTAVRARGATSYVAPIDVVTKVTDDVLAAGHPRHSWLGIEGVDRTSDPGTGFGLVGGEDSGIVVSSVAPDGPGAAAGLQPSDVIVAIGGQPIERMPDLVRWLRARSPGEVAELTVRRAGADRAVTVTLGELAAG